MSIEYTFLSRKENLQGTKLQVCSDDNMHLSVLQYKRTGNLMYSHKEGMYSKNQEGQAAQIRAFLEIADENGVDLVITPEASVPRKVIEEIIDGSIRPEEGKLWCLGAEGMNKKIYRSLVQKWKRNKEIVFISPKINNTVKHFNTLFYFFMTAEEKLAVVVQAKTGAMRDEGFDHEQADLSTGNEIFILDLNGGKQSQSVLATLICADILNVNVTDFCSSFHGKSPIILNIQMNAKPFHGKIIEFRKTFFADESINMGQMIVANWGKDTTIQIEGGKEKRHKDSGSAIYLPLEFNHGRSGMGEILEQAGFIVDMGTAQKSGLEYFVTRNYEIWKIQEDIQVGYYKTKIACKQRHNMMTRKYLPYVIEKYRYDNENCLVKDEGLRCDCEDMKEVLGKFGKRASDDMKKCANKTCDECVRFYVDALISLCLGEGILEEFEIRGGRSYRTVQAMYQDSKDVKKKELIGKLVQGLARMEFPKRFAELSENRNTCFAINYDAAKNGGNYKYNLELKCDSGKRRILAVYLGDMDKAEVKRKYIELKNAVHEDIQNDILLFYFDKGRKKVYAEPYEKESILADNHDFSQDIETFK